MTDIEPTELPEESELQPPAEVDEAPQAEADDTPQAEVDYTPQAEVDDASADLEVVALSVEAAESPSPADVSSSPAKAAADHPPPAAHGRRSSRAVPDRRGCRVRMAERPGR